MFRSTIQSRRLAHVLSVDGDNTAGGDTKTEQTEGEQKEPDADTATDTKRTPEDDAAHWKAMARQWENRSKANHTELENLRRGQMTDTEKALDEARAEGRTSALREAGGTLVATALIAGLVGRGVSAEDAKAEVEDLDMTRFLTAEGGVDHERVTARINRAAPQQPKHAGASTLGMGRTPQQTAKPGADGQAEAARRYPARAK